MKWVTRERPKIDRIACPWLIVRFIDLTPEFLYVPASDVLRVAAETGATPYDIPGVEMTHVGELCSFDAFTVEAPPLYKNDCEPDPPQHGNRFVWDGISPQRTAEEPVAEKLDPVAYAECLKQLPQDSIEAEAASDERQQKHWASPNLGR